MKTPKLLVLFAAALFTAAPHPARAAETYLTQDRPVDAGELRIGLSNAQSGRSAALGGEVRRGCEAFLQKLNAAGGVHGRKLKLVSYDDCYEPLLCMVNTQKLVNDDKVFALCNFVGTPTTRAVQPMIDEARIPLVGVFTGAEALREPADPFVFNVRASYNQETEALVNHLIDDSKANRIAVFLQNDGFGDAVRAGVVRALQKRGAGLAGTGTYNRNTVDVEAGLEALVAAKPDAVIMAGTYQPCAALVRAARRRGLNAAFCSVSFIGTEDFITAAGRDAEGVYISQVLPPPADTSVPLVAEYQAALSAAGGKGEARFTYASLEGYVNAAVLAAGLQHAGAQLTVNGFVAALETLDTDLGGLRCAFTPSNRQGLKNVYLTRVGDGQAKPVQNFSR